MRSQLALTIASGVMLALITLACGKEKSAAVELIERHTFESVVNVHGSPETDIRVCGRVFRSVKGAPPYYLSVKNTSWILFAYEPSKSTRKLVLCDTNLCVFHEADLRGIVFGNQIGYADALRGGMGDRVEAVENNRIYLLHNGFRYVERSVFDLTTGSVRVLGVKSEWNVLDLSWLTNRSAGDSAPVLRNPASTAPEVGR